jgi:CRISPR-associated protein Csx3
MIKFSEKGFKGFVMIGFEVGDIIKPEALKTLTPPDPIAQNFAHLGVVLSGRGPFWFYGFLVHYYHPTKWVATHDPRLQGAVVVASHTPEIKVGEIIPLEI